MIRRVKGFRYLVQGRAKGLMLEEGMREGLRWMGKMGLVFELGVDFRGDGSERVREAVEGLEKVGEGRGVVVVSESSFDHLERYLIAPRSLAVSL